MILAAWGLLVLFIVLLAALTARCDCTTCNHERENHYERR